MATEKQLAAAKKARAARQAKGTKKYKKRNQNELEELKRAIVQVMRELSKFSEELHTVQKNGHVIQDVMTIDSLRNRIDNIVAGLVTGRFERKE